MLDVEAPRPLFLYTPLPPALYSPRQRRHPTTTLFHPPVHFSTHLHAHRRRTALFLPTYTRTHTAPLFLAYPTVLPDCQQETDDSKEIVFTVKFALSRESLLADVGRLSQRDSLEREVVLVRRVSLLPFRAADSPSPPTPVSLGLNPR